MFLIRWLGSINRWSVGFFNPTPPSTRWEEYESFDKKAREQAEQLCNYLNGGTTQLQYKTNCSFEEDE